LRAAFELRSEKRERQANTTSVADRSVGECIAGLHSWPKSLTGVIPSFLFCRELTIYLRILEISLGLRYFISVLFFGNGRPCSRPHGE
jgi:hypothetical protein